MLPDFPMPSAAPNASQRSGHWTVGPEKFATTQWSLVLEAGRRDGNDPAVLERWCRLYWHPVYAFVRRRGHPAEDARDLTQEFFARLLERQWLERVEPGPARFRTWLLTLLTRFLVNQHEHDRALKRGGGAKWVPLDLAELEHRLARDDERITAPPERAFARQWALSVLRQGLERLREECGDGERAALFTALCPFLSRDPSSGEYDALAASLHRQPGSLRMTVLRLRRRYRACLQEILVQQALPEADPETELRECLAALLDEG